MQITVPMGGSNVIPEGEGPSRHPGDSASTPTLSQRKSLHTVRMTAQVAQPEYKPEWKENGQLKWVPAEAAAEEPAAEEQHLESPVPRGNDNGGNDDIQAMRREMAELRQYMAQQQAPQQPQGPTPPDPADFDMYEPSQVKEFHRLNNEYIQATVQQSLHAALAPHQGAMQAAEYTRQYNSVLADYGNDPNFKPIMDKALQMVASSNGRFSIPEAYDLVTSAQITSPQAAQPQGYVKQPRTLTAQEAAQKDAQARSLPQRNGVSGAGEPALPAALMNVGALGRIMLHNQQTGRARPL